MRRCLQRLRKTGLKAKRLFSNFIILLAIISCARDFTLPPDLDKPAPSKLKFAYTIELDIPKFLPQHITVDITGRIYLTGNSRRLIFIKKGEHPAEVMLESIYPCNITDIDTDGFDIFLLDRLNKKIWTIKQRTLLERGFLLQERPLNFAISERNSMVITFVNSKEISVFSKHEKLFTAMHLAVPLREDDTVDLLFRNNVLYIAEMGNDKLNILPLFNPSQKQTLAIPSPASLAMDRSGHLFIAYAQGIGSLLDNDMEVLHPLHGEHLEISIARDSLFLLRPSAGKIDVYSIVYTPSGANAP